MKPKARNTATIIENNPCLKHNCSFCCNPVKINCLKIVDTKRDSLPFTEKREILISIKHPGSIRLKSYYCANFNFETGLCEDYFNRPLICRNTKCLLFKIKSKQEQIKFIEIIKSEEFIKIPY